MGNESFRAEWLAGMQHASGCMSPGLSLGEARRRRDGVGVGRIERGRKANPSGSSPGLHASSSGVLLDPSGACSSVGRICGPRSPRPQPTGALTTALVRKIHPGSPSASSSAVRPYRLTACFRAGWLTVSPGIRSVRPVMHRASFFPSALGSLHTHTLLSAKRAVDVTSAATNFEHRCGRNKTRPCGLRFSYVHTRVCPS